MARGRSVPRHEAPPALRMPPDSERQGLVAGDLVRAEPEVRAVLRAFNRGYRVPGAEIGVYSNGREQGYRITRSAAPACTVWFSLNRNSDDYVLYFLREASTAITIADLPQPASREFFAFDAGRQVVARIAELLSADQLAGPGHETRGRSIDEALASRRR